MDGERKREFGEKFIAFAQQTRDEPRYRRATEASRLHKYAILHITM